MTARIRKFFNDFSDRIIDQIKLPDYRDRHIFIGRLRVVIFIVFWTTYAISFKSRWEQTFLFPISVSVAFLITGFFYHNILRGKKILFSLFMEMVWDTISITIIIYMTGGEQSKLFYFYILYCLVAGILFTNIFAITGVILSLFCCGTLILLLYFEIIPSFNYSSESFSFFTSKETNFFLSFISLLVFLPLAVYAVRIANGFSHIKLQALESRNKQLIALNRISSAIKGTMSIEKVVRKVLSGVIEGLGYDTCFLVIPNFKTNLTSIYAPRNHPNTRKIEEVLGVPISSLRIPNLKMNSVFHSIQKHKILFRENLHELTEGVFPLISEKVAQKIQKTLRFKKFIVTPLVAERRVLGALVGATHEDFVDETRVGVLENFSNQAALAIESAQLFEEIKQTNIDLERANKIKSNFMAIMSHELRTPLTAIIGFSELLLEEGAGLLNEEQKKYLKEVYSSSEHLLQLINSILDLSKIESGKMELSLEAFNLTELVSEVHQNVQSLAKKKNLELLLEIKTEIPEMIADPLKVKQIFLNLLSNSIKFTPEGGKITTSLYYFNELETLDSQHLGQETGAYYGGYYRCTVEDTGIGMEEKDLKKIFNPFSQVDSSYTRKYQGTGLGLTLTKQFVEMHQGKIWAESEYQKGSKFSFILPLKNKEEIVSV